MRRIASITALFMLVFATTALPAHAAENVGTFSELADAAETCPAGDSTAILDNNISATGSVLTVECDLIIDVAGYDLALQRIVINDGEHLTITDTVGGGQVTLNGGSNGPGIRTTNAELTITGEVTVVATAGGNNAGIGGGNGADGGTVIIGGNADVTASATSLYGAGIGGGREGDGGTITINDNANVTANGGGFGAGIGGGDGGTTSGVLGNGGNVTVNGSATVTATGGTSGAGIGGGYGGDGGTLVINDSATVTGSGISPVGPGAGKSSLGVLEVYGTFYMPSGTLFFSTGTFNVHPGGHVLGQVGDETDGTLISGAGTINNDGVIALDESLVSVTVTGNNYLVDFDTQGGTNPSDVRVFATSFDAGYRDLPAPPTDTEWNTSADGTGDWFTDTSTLAGDTTLFAATGPAVDIELSAPSATVTEGDSITFIVTATDQFGNPTDTSGVVLTSSVETDIIDGLTVTFPTASPHVITATLGSLSSSVTVEVLSADLLAESGPSAAGLTSSAALLLIALGATLIARNRRTL